MSCCRRSSGMSPKVLAQVQTKLQSIHKIFPGTNLLALLSANGSLITSENKKSKVPEEMMAPILSLKKAAIQFGMTLNQMECPVIHIRGNTTMFSCYEVERFLLAFYSDMNQAELASFDTSAADARMYEEVIDDLRLLLEHLFV